MSVNQWFVKKEAEKMGLVLGGGGARGCYEIGAWQAFAENGIAFDTVSGTSIGALVGAIYTQQTLERIEEFVVHLKPAHIVEGMFAFPETFGELVKDHKEISGFLEQYIFTGTGADISPLKDAVHQMFDYQKFHESSINFACMTFNVTQKKPEAYFKKEMNEENAENIILASASCYPAFPMMEMNGSSYIDGGYWNNLPIDLAAKMGARKILAIDVEGPGVIQPYNKKLDVKIVKPMLPIGNFLDFSNEEGRRSMHIGYLEMSRFLGRYTGYLFTFTREDENDMQFMDGYLATMFMLKKIQIPKNYGERIIKTLTGFHSSALSDRHIEGYKYGELTEALAYLAGIEPVGLYHYHQFVSMLLNKLSELNTSRIHPEDHNVIEWMKSLSRIDLVKVIYDWILHSGGEMNDSLKTIRMFFSTEFILAWTWYFLGVVYEHAIS